MEHNRTPTIGELAEMLRNLTEAVTMLTRTHMVKQEEVTHMEMEKGTVEGNKGNGPLPELDKWDRKRNVEWIKRTSQWIEVAKLHFKSGELQQKQIYSRLKLACSEDDEAMMLIKATESAGYAETLNMFEKVFVNGRREDEDIIQQIANFSIRPGTKLATNWLYYKALVERSMQLQQYPGDEMVSRIFMNQVMKSQFNILGQQIRFKYPSDPVIPWNFLITELDRVYTNWDSTFSYPNERPKKPLNSLERKPVKEEAFVHRRPLTEEDKRNVVCYRCNQRGHISKYCKGTSTKINQVINKEDKRTKPTKIMSAIVDTGAQTNVFSMRH